MLDAENEAKSSKNGVWSIKGFVDEKKHHYNRNDAA
jgi:micrococcal nuclease